MGDRTLVLGGTGKTGSRVAARLTALGVQVRIGSRTAAEPRFEWDDRTTWGPVFDGVDKAYIVYSPEIAFPGAADTIGEFANAAVTAGVRRLVLLSGRGDEVHAGASEKAVRDSGAEWTILRAAWFNQNFSESFMYEPVVHGVIELPAGDVAEPFVDVEDIADTAVAALTTDNHLGQTYDLSGPRLLTFGDAAAEIGAARGKEVGYVPVTFVEYGKMLREHGLPLAYVEMFRKVLDGRNSYLGDGVQRALGREPRDFADYARKTAETGVWS
ncbi:NAD(P)H-binding protein [Actinosynnema sp. ALI-1.44]|uniref:NAD(P)H-binding protein n=1 Tax=Actinosynnema sp. ALI-1.44 TaxID=1933779 RepID=UPI0018756580|nr:NAD(P)H-binding protein [Actinosynnema sp. ALI-1.44]